MSAIGKCLDVSPYRRYVQFSDLVFDTELDSAQYSINTKVETQPYSWGHGSYVPFKEEQLLLSEADVSISATFDYRLYHREDRKFIKDWIKLNMLKPGRLWAIEGNKLIWAWAFITGYSETYTKFKRTFSIDFDFKLWEGYWHIADPHYTFLIPYDSCNIMDCLDFKDELDCSSCCTECIIGKEQLCDNCLCECGEITREDALCAWDRAKLFSMFCVCGHSMKIVYDCIKAEKFFHDDERMVQICKDDICKEVIAGQFYSNTIVDTDLIDITLVGNFDNPEITINDKTTTIGAQFEGILHIYRNGDITFQCDGCTEEEDQNPMNFTIDGDMSWKVHHGKNRVIVKGICCEMACILLNIDELTI